MGEETILMGRVIEVSAIDDYLSGVPDEQRAALDALREAVAQAAPEAAGLMWFVAVVFGLGALLVAATRARSGSRPVPQVG